MKILLLCATKTERAGLHQSLQIKKSHDFTSGFSFYHTNDESVFIGQTGIGFEQTQKFLDQLKTLSLNFDLIFQFGLSGALIEEIQAKDLILVSKIYSKLSDEQIELDDSIIAKLESYLKEINDTYHKGALLSSPEVLSTPTQKKKMGEAYKAIAVDMESFLVAKYALENCISYISLRVCFDHMSKDLTQLDQADLVSAEGEVKPFHLITGLVKNPKLIMNLPEFQKISSQGLKKIHEIIKKFILIEK